MKTGVNLVQWVNPLTGGHEIGEIVLPNEINGEQPIAVRRNDRTETLVRCYHTHVLTWVPNSLLSDYFGDSTP